MIKRILFVLFVACLISCQPAANSTSKALDNANQLLKDGGEKLYDQPVTATPIPTPMM